MTFILSFPPDTRLVSRTLVFFMMLTVYVRLTVAALLWLFYNLFQLNNLLTLNKQQRDQIEKLQLPVEASQMVYDQVLLGFASANLHGFKSIIG